MYLHLYKTCPYQKHHVSTPYTIHHRRFTENSQLNSNYKYHQKGKHLISIDKVIIVKDLLFEYLLDNYNLQQVCPIYSNRSFQVDFRTRICFFIPLKSMQHNIYICICNYLQVRLIIRLNFKKKFRLYEIKVKTNKIRIPKKKE